MTTISARGMAFSLLASAISITGVQAAQPQNPPPTVVPLTNVFTTMQPAESRASSSAANVIQFGTSDSLREKAERLKDPQQRREVRIEERARLAESNRDLRAVLELDDATEEKVLELLTDQQMERLDEMFLRTENGSIPGRLWVDLTQAQAETQTVYIQALREVLGQEKLERYQAFERTFGERGRVAQLDARLAPAHKLQPDQRERLIGLYQDDTARYVAEMRMDRQPFAPFGRYMQTVTSIEEMQRQSQLMAIAGNEQNWRRLPEARRSLRQRAAAILTPAQLATLQQMHEEEIDGLRQWIERLRVEAGLSAQIPAEPEESEVANRTPIAGEVKFRIQLTVNRNEPNKFSHVGGNGASVTFECADGLLMEVTPLLYDDDVYNVEVTYYEQGSNGKRRIGQSGQSGVLEKQQPGSASLEFSGSSTTILTGNKGYAVELKARLEPA